MKPAPAKFLGTFLVALALVAAAVGIAQVTRVQLLHRATATVRVERDETDLPDTGSGMPSGADMDFILQTEAGIIPSEIILKPVIEKLDLNSIWGERYNDGQKLKTTESFAYLKSSLKAAPVSGSALIRIDVTREDADETMKIANAVAQSYCDYRADRRRRINESALKNIAELSKVPLEKFTIARKNLEDAQNALPPDIRANPPMLTINETPALRAAQARHNQATIQSLSRSNQIANARHSASPDTNLIARVTTELSRLQVELDDAAAAVKIESKRLDALREYWVAQANLENAEKMFAPFKKAADEAHLTSSAMNKPPAVIADHAEKAGTIEAHDTSRGAVSFGIASVLLLVGAGVLLSNRPPIRSENLKAA